MKKSYLKLFSFLVTILFFLFIPSIVIYAGGVKQEVLDECNKKNAKLESENSELKSQNSTLESKISTLQEQKAELEKKISDLEGKIVKKEEEVKAKEEEAADLTIVSKQVEERIQEKETIIAELEMKKETEMAELRNEKEAEIAAMRRKGEAMIADLRKEREELETQARKIKIELTKLEAENHKLKKEKEATERVLEEYEKVQKESMELMDLALKRINKILREEIETGKVRVYKGTMGIVLDVLGEYMFDVGSVEINPGGKEILGKIAVLLDELEGYFVGIIGNADSKPIVTPSLKKRFPTNWELSAYRGSVIVRYLLSNSDISPRRMVVMGLGEFQPIDDNFTVEGRGNNRRADIILLPIDVIAAVVVGGEIK